MFTQLFGCYLLREKILTPEQLQNALEATSRTKVMLGALAMDAGYLDSTQVERICIEQRRADKRFGDIAVELGYMSFEKVNELLAKQKSSDLALGQALIDLGYLSNKQFEKCLNDYKANISDRTGKNDEENLTADFVKVFELEKFADNSLHIDYMLLLARNLVRFVGSDFAFIGRAQGNAYDCLCSQEIIGDISGYTAMGGNEAQLAEFASRFADERLETPGYVHDGICEFLNLQNGLLAVNYSLNNDIELSLLPPTAVADAKFTKKNSLIATIMFSFGPLDFIIARK